MGPKERADFIQRRFDVKIFSPDEIQVVRDFSRRDSSRRRFFQDIFSPEENISERRFFLGYFLRRDFCLGDFLVMPWLITFKLECIYAEFQ